jgi:hypothetical protein
MTAKHITHAADIFLQNGQIFTRRVMRELANGEFKATVKWDGCIHPDTIVLTNKGDIRISEIIANPNSYTVFGYDESTSAYKIAEILGTSRKIGPKRWIEIHLADGGVLNVTFDHQIHTSNRGWVEAANLTTEDDITEIETNAIALLLNNVEGAPDDSDYTGTTRNNSTKIP